MKCIAAIDFACNDPDNGLFAGRANSAQYGDIEIEAPCWDGYAFSLVDIGPDAEAIRIHRRKFPIDGPKEWLGNWCWNRYFLLRDDMKRLLLHLRRNGWRVTCGPSRFYDWWNAGLPQRVRDTVADSDGDDGA
mgnify:FL=1